MFGTIVSSSIEADLDVFQFLQELKLVALVALAFTFQDFTHQHHV